MKSLFYCTSILILIGISTSDAFSQDQRSYQIFQFPPDKIPSIDGKAGDWDIVPTAYVIGMDQLWDDTKKHPSVDTTNLNVKVKVGWVEGPQGKSRLSKVWDVVVR